MRSAGLSSQAATQLTLYVDQGSIGGQCSDSFSATQAQSQTTPLCTLDQALTLASSGSTVLLRAGAYPALTVNGGNRTALVTVAAYGSETVSLPSIVLGSDTDFLRFQGLRLTGDANASDLDVGAGSHDVQIADSQIASQTQDAIALRPGVANVLIDGNHISSKAPGATDGGDGIAFDSTSTLPDSPPGNPADAPISDVTISNNRFDNIGVDAIRPANFVNLKIEGNDITGINENGEHTDAIQTVFGGTNLDVESNLIHNNGGEGILIKDGQVTGAVIANNVVVHTTAEIQLQVFDTIGLTIVNNTFWDNEYNVVLRPGVRNAVIRNNIFQDEVAEDPAESAQNVHQDYNLVADGWNWGAVGPHDISTPPAFVDPAANDYRLASGSAGIDAGDGSAAPLFDKACRARYDAPGVANKGTGTPRYVDIGALEYGPSSQAGDTAAPFDPNCGNSIPPCSCTTTTPTTPTTPTGTGTTPTTTPPGRIATAGAAGQGTAAAGADSNPNGAAGVSGTPAGGVAGASTSRTPARCGWLRLGSVRAVGQRLALTIKAKRSGTLRLSARLSWVKTGSARQLGSLISAHGKVKKGHSLILKLKVRNQDLGSARRHRGSARLQLSISGSSAGTVCANTAALGLAL
jgi:Right handed beta helix region